MLVDLSRYIYIYISTSYGYDPTNKSMSVLLSLKKTPKNSDLLLHIVSHVANTEKKMSSINYFCGGGGLLSMRFSIKHFESKVNAPIRH